MRQDSPAGTLAWMATGAAVLAAGALLGSAAGRSKGRAPRRDEDAGLTRDPLEDLADRPVACAVLTESVAAARRVDTLAESVASLEARVQAVERAAQTSAAEPAERLEAIWRRVALIEERVERIRAERAEMPSLDTIVAQAENRLAPRIQVIETRVAEHHAVVQQLREQASQTETNLQKMIAAVERLADQMSHILPPQAQRIEPKREGAAATPASAAGADAAGETTQASAAGGGPTELPAGDPHAAAQGTPFRWKSLALVAALAVNLAGPWGHRSPGSAAIPRRAAAMARSVAPKPLDSQTARPSDH